MIHIVLFLWTSCYRISNEEISKMTNYEIAEIAKKPIVITNAMNFWKNRSIDEFEKDFGHHRILARRTKFASYG